MSRFATAKPVNAPKAAAKGGSNKEHVEAVGLKQFAEIRALVDALTTLNEAGERDLKEEALKHFVATAGGKRPVSYRATEGNASASMEIRRRSSRSPLTEGEIEQLTQLGIKAEKATVVQKMFGFNPKYTEDQDVLAKIEKALDSVKGLPEDLIVVQEEKSGWIVGESTFDDAFRKGATAEVVKMVAVLAIKPKLEETDLTGIIERVKAIIAPKQPEATDFIE